jgi:hypothetical protein
MTLMLELRPETEARLHAEAARRGIGVDLLARELIEASVPKLPGELTVEEFEALLDELAAGGEEFPVLSRDVIDSRAFYYEGRG